MTIRQVADRSISVAVPSDIENVLVFNGTTDLNAILAEAPNNFGFPFHVATGGATVTTGNGLETVIDGVVSFSAGSQSQEIAEGVTGHVYKLPNGAVGVSYSTVGTTEWTSYTPTVTSPNGTDPGLGTAPVNEAYYTVVGKTLEIMGWLTTGATASAGTGDHYAWSLPAGFTPAAWAVSTFEASQVGMRTIGTGQASDVGAGGSAQGSGPAFLVADGICYAADDDGGQEGFIDSGFYDTGLAAKTYSYRVSIPLA